MISVSDPGASYRYYRREIDEAVSNVLESGQYVLGHEVAEFEREFAQYVGAPACVGVANGTDAITLALQVCLVGEGWDVIVPAFGATATAIGAAQTGARVIFADVLPNMTLDPDSVRRCIELASRSRAAGRPVAVVAVHLFGVRPELEQLRDVVGASANGATLHS